MKSKYGCKEESDMWEMGEGIKKKRIKNTSKVEKQKKMKGHIKRKRKTGQWGKRKIACRKEEKIDNVMSVYSADNCWDPLAGQCNVVWLLSFGII